MTVMLPCNHCHRCADCDKRQQIRRTIKGLGLSSVYVRCSIYNADYRPGRRVMVGLRCFEDCGPDDYYGYTAPFVGTIMRRMDRKFLVCLDTQREHVPTGHGFTRGTKGACAKKQVLKVFPSRLTFLDEPDRALCKSCGFPDGVENLDEWNCETAPHGEPQNVPDHNGLCDPDPDGTALRSVAAAGGVWP